MHKSIRTILKHVLKMSTVVFDISERKGIFPNYLLSLFNSKRQLPSIDRSAICDIMKNGRKFDEVLTKETHFPLIMRFCHFCPQWYKNMAFWRKILSQHGKNNQKSICVCHICCSSQKYRVLEHKWHNLKSCVIKYVPTPLITAWLPCFLWSKIWWKRIRTIESCALLLEKSTWSFDHWQTLC